MASGPAARVVWLRPASRERSWSRRRRAASVAAGGGVGLFVEVAHGLGEFDGRAAGQKDGHADGAAAAAEAEDEQHEEQSGLQGDPAQGKAPGGVPEGERDAVEGLVEEDGAGVAWVVVDAGEEEGGGRGPA